MSPVKKEKIYQSLPHIYDHLMRKIRYDYWADYLFRLASEYITTKASVLELAAGNCNLAKFLVKNYPDLIVSDLSIGMLDSSDNKTLRKVCCDMIALPFKKHFDLIYITFDSINYLLTKKKILLLFQEVKNILSNDGILTFDASLERNSICHVSEPIRKAKHNGYNYVHKSIYNKKTHIHKNIFDITFPDGNIYEEIHRQKILDFHSFFDLIEKAGLYVVECFDAFTFKNGKASSKRAQFVVKKVQER